MCPSVDRSALNVQICHLTLYNCSPSRATCISVTINGDSHPRHFADLGRHLHHPLVPTPRSPEDPEDLRICILTAPGPHSCFGKPPALLPVHFHPLEGTASYLKPPWIVLPSTALFYEYDGRQNSQLRTSVPTGVEFYTLFSPLP